MPRFRFVARDPSGRTRRDTQEAASEVALLEQLRANGLVTLEIERAVSGEPPPTRRRVWVGLFPPRSIDVEVGVQQIAFMLKSGLPLVQTLATCSAQSERASMGRIWRAVSERIQSGASLSDALATHRCFPNLLVRMVAVGEHTGDLEGVLARGAEAMERRREHKAAVATALVYPTIVTVLAIGVVAFMMVSLIPKLSKFLGSFGRRLPATTQLLVDVSAYVHGHVLHGLIGFALAVATLLVVHRWPPGRVVIDRLLLRLPVVGNVLRLAGTATFARNLGALVTSGVRLTEALRIVEPLLGNQFLGRQVAAARERVLHGASLAELLAAPGGFLPMLASMVAVGESSGTLDQVLRNVAEFHETRLQAVIRRLAAIVEPTILLVIAFVVGFVYMSFFMALYAIVGVR